MGPFEDINNIKGSIKDNLKSKIPSNPLNGVFPSNKNTPTLDPKNVFPTTATLNDDQKTPITAFWEKGISGYPVFSCQAVKQYSEGPKTFTSKKLSIPSKPTEDELNSSLSNIFFNLSQEIYVYDSKLKLENGKTEYSPELYNFVYPTNVPWKEPKPSPQDKEEEREAIKITNKKRTKKTKSLKVNEEAILNAIPSDLKTTGASKLPELIYKLGETIPIIILPVLENLIIEYITNYIKDNIDLCPPRNVLENLTILRNRIVNQLNKIVNNIEKIGSSISGIQQFLKGVLKSITGIELASIGISAGAKALVPPVIIPGAITSALNDAQTFIRKQTFDKLGNSKLSKATATVASASMVMSLIAGYVLQALALLEIIDNILKKCAPDLTLDSISDEVKTMSLLQLNAQNTQNDTTYKGFVIDIITVPYTPTVNRIQAVAKNKYGIIMITGNLSFTSSNQTLINELKLIIDRDNLTGY
jgi:hypothetical protein